MKQPEDSFAGSSRKTLLKRNVRKSKTSVAPGRTASKKQPLNPDVEREMMKTFAEK